MGIAALFGQWTGRRINSLGHNFRTFGTSFGVYEYEDYVQLAKKFYREGMHAEGEEYSVVQMKDGRTAIDFNGEVRGVYDRYGNPLAFFCPDYRQLGFRSRQEELDAFRAGKEILAA